MKKTKFVAVAKSYTALRKSVSHEGAAKRPESSFTIAKTEPDKMLVFGWGNVAVDENGNQVVDLQGDVIDPKELERAAYDHVLKFRSAGEKHDPKLRHKGRLVESCVFTKEKQAAIGIPPGVVPEGWWIGYKIDDPAAWEKIKKGEYLSFSVEGQGRRTPIVEKEQRSFSDFPGYDEWLEENLDASAEKMRAAKEFFHGRGHKCLAKSYLEIRKYNPYHDARGRFTSRNAHTTFSPGSNPNQARQSIDAENKRRAAEGVDQLVTGAYMTVGKVAYASSLKAYLDAQAKKKDPIQQTAAPAKAGKSVDWKSMSDDEFVQNLETYMPGINDIATKGWASTHNRWDYQDSSLNGDMVLTDIYKARGYNAAPQMMDKADIKAYISQNGTPDLYRGMGTSSHGQSGAEKMDRFEKDPLHFAGYGVLGNGTYAAQTPPNVPFNTGLRVATQYSSRGGNGVQVRMTIKKDTKTAAYTTVRRQQRDFIGRVRTASYNGKIDRSLADTIVNICSDVGRFGALRGYEAWYDKTGAHSGARRSSPFWVVVNRGKMIIQNERYTR